MVDGWVRRCGSRVDVNALGVFGGCRGLWCLRCLFLLVFLFPITRSFYCVVSLTMVDN
ncbi:hypothetical protein BDV41DRAFT_526174, partial [Aspergillus transmontanensis]